jgi:hypothetical protein
MESWDRQRTKANFWGIGIIGEPIATATEVHDLVSVKGW